MSFTFASNLEELAKQVGGWQRGLEKALGRAVLAEGHFMRTKVIEGLDEQAPAGQAFAPLSPLTLKRREEKGFGGTKALIVRGDLRNSVSVVREGDEVFVGVLKNAMGKQGQPLVNVAELNEHGALIVRTTASGAVALQAIPARPFLSPVFNRYAEGSGERVLKRVARELGIPGGE